MTAAASPREATKTRPSRARTSANGLDDLPVLLRLPRVGSNDSSKSNSSRHASTAPDPQTETAQDQETSRRNRGNPRGERSAAESPSTKRTTGAKILGLLWRIGVVAAAIALIVLAYRIINGPPAPQSASLPDISDMPAIEDAPGALPLPQDSTGEHDISPMPTIVKPNLSLSDHGELPGSDKTTEPIAEQQFDVDDHNFSPAPLVSGDADAPRASLSSMPRTLATEDDAGEQDAWTEQTSSRPWAEQENFDSADASDTSWDNTADTPVVSTTSYPESDRSTWRTAEQWFLAAEAAAREEEQAANPAWDDSERSAARLRPEIEQPPLPRDRLR